MVPPSPVTEIPSTNLVNFSIDTWFMGELENHVKLVVGSSKKSLYRNEPRSSVPVVRGLLSDNTPLTTLHHLSIDIPVSLWKNSVYTHKSNLNNGLQQTVDVGNMSTILTVL